MDIVLACVSCALYRDTLYCARLCCSLVAWDSSPDAGSCQATHIVCVYMCALTQLHMYGTSYTKDN